jgi:hypothetical protein
MSRDSRLNELCLRRSELKHAKRFQEAMLLQVQIIELLEAEGVPKNELAVAHNMASVLCLGCKSYSDAELHARRALSLHEGNSLKDHEARGAYNLVMARILASRFEFQDAVPFGETSIAEYSHFHNPPDEFLSQIVAEVERIKNHTWSPEH